MWCWCRFGHVTPRKLPVGGDSGRGAERAEDAQGTPTQSHISPSILVYEDYPWAACCTATARAKSFNAVFNLRFRGGLVFKADRLLYHSTLGLTRRVQSAGVHRKVDVRLPGKGISNGCGGARPDHLIITMIKWIRTSRLSIKNSLSAEVPRTTVTKCTAVN